jgi:hypothetical protein
MDKNEMKSVIIRMEHRQRKLLRQFLAIQEDDVTMQDYITGLIKEDLRKKGVNW